MTDAQNIVNLSLDLSPELNEILEELARKIGGSKSDVLRQAITMMQIMVTAKEQIKTFGITEAVRLIANEIVMPSEAEQKYYQLEAFMEKFGAWEDERTSEEIVKDIYESRTISNTEYQL